MTAAIPPNSSDEPLVRIEQKIEALAGVVGTLANDVEGLSNDVEGLSGEVKTLYSSMERSNDKFDTYQKATQWVVQLAFTLIASATITVIVSSVLN